MKITLEVKDYDPEKLEYALKTNITGITGKLAAKAANFCGKLKKMNIGEKVIIKAAGSFNGLILKAVNKKASEYGISIGKITIEADDNLELGDGLKGFL